MATPDTATPVGAIGIKVLPLTQEFRRDLKEALATLKPSIDVKLQIDEKSLGKIRQQLNRLEDDLVVVDVDPQLRERSVQKVKKQIRDLQDGVKVHLGVDLDSGVARARLKLLQRPREVKLFPKVDKSAAAKATAVLAALSGARLLHTQLDNIWQRLKDIDKSIPRIATLATSFGTALGAVLSLSSNLFALGTSLARIGPLALALPGIFGGMAIGIGSMIAVFMDFNKVLPEVGEALSAMRKVMSERFWAEAAKPMGEFFSTMLPLFAAGVAGTSTQLGSLFGMLASTLQSTLAPVMGTMFAGLNKSIEIAKGGMIGIANTLQVLGTMGSSYLPALAGWFVDISNRFGEFLLKAQQDGSLKVWIDTAVTELGNLGNVIRFTASILSSIGAAAEAAGGTTLGSLAEALRQVAEAAKDPAFQTGLTATLRSAHQMMETISGMAGPNVHAFFAAFSGTLQQIFPLIGNTVGTLLNSLSGALAQPAFLDGLVQAFQGISNLAGSLAPAFGPVAAAIGSLLSLVGTLATAFGPVLAEALIPLANIIVELVPLIQPLVTMLAGVLVAALQAIMPPVVELVKVLVASLMPVFAALIPVVMQIIGALMPLVTMILNLVVTAFAPLLAAIMPLVTALLPLLSQLILGLVGAIMPLMPVIIQITMILISILVPIIQVLSTILIAVLGPAFQLITEVIAGVVQMISGFINIIMGLVTGDMAQFEQGMKDVFFGMLNTVGGIVNNLGRLVMSLFGAIPPNVLDTLAGMGQGIADFFGGIGPTVSGLLSKFGSSLSDIFKKALEAAGGAVSKGIGDAVGFFSGIGGKITGKIGDLSGLLSGTGGDIIAGLLSGINGAVGGLMARAGEIAGSIKSTINGALGIKSPSRVMMETGGFVIAGLTKGLTDEAWKLRPVMESVAAIISGAELALADPTAQWSNVSGEFATSLAAQVIPADERNTFLVQNPWGPEYMATKTDERVGTYVDNDYYRR